MNGSMPCPCGQCIPCLKKRRFLWASRIVLESLTHDKNCFVTLTYKPETVPEGGTLVPKHTQDWLKRLRRAIEPATVRYFLCGEYGDVSERPHYHAALFGLGPEDEDIICRSWGHGFVQVGDLNIKSAQYISGYVTKKMTRKDDARLKGRHPEFARMSLRPGIGATAVPTIGDVLFSMFGAEEVNNTGDVPFALKIGSRSLPLGRYLRGKLRDEIGMPETWKEEKLKEYSKEMQALFLDALGDQTLAPEDKLTIKTVLHRKNAQKILNLTTKSKIFEGKKTL